jgi:hypothetical protein
MSERVEKLIREYPQMKTEVKCLENLIRDFRGISETEMIESMLYSHPEGERVQTSGVSDKTARIAISYREKMERINKEWYDYLEQKYLLLSEELRFFESALGSLSGNLPAIMSDMVIARLTWDEISEKYFVSRTMVAKYRKKAISELDVLFTAHDADVAAYILD